MIRRILIGLLLGGFVTGCQTVETATEKIKTSAEQLNARLETAFGTADLHRDMTERDIDLAAETFQTAMEKAGDGERSIWANPRSGNSGRFRPVRTFVTDAGTFCRDFEETLRVDAREGAYENVACRRDSGGWDWVKN